MFRTVAAVTFALIVSLPSRAQQPPPETLFSKGHYLRAQPLILDYLQKHPSDANALIKASEIEWAFFHPDQSLALAEKAVAADDKNPRAHVQLTNALGVKLMSSNAGTFEKINAARRFRKEAEIALQLNPNDPDAYEDMAQYLWNAPSMVGGDKAQAQQLADRLFQLDPARGATLKAAFAADDKDKGRRQAAIEAIWKQAIAARPQDYDAHIGLSAACFELGSDHQGGDYLRTSEDEARRALALDPTRIPAYRQLAILYASTQRWDQLDAILTRARAAVPDDLSPHYHAARIILVQNIDSQWTRAMQYLHAYLAQPAEGQEPTHAAAHWRLGLLLEKQGQKADAVREIQAAVSQDPTLVPAKKDLKRLQ